MNVKAANDPKNMVVGDPLPALTKIVTQKIIDKWAEVSGDYNPLHIDPEFGKSTFFGTNIAHGPISLSLIIEMLTLWMGKSWFSGGRLYDVRLVAPVPPDTKITIGGKIVSIKHDKDQQRVECLIFVKNEEDKILITGKASCLI